LWRKFGLADSWRKTGWRIFRLNKPLTELNFLAVAGVAGIYLRFNFLSAIKALRPFGGVPLLKERLVLRFQCAAIPLV
jgi:hypothetical protein